MEPKKTEIAAQLQNNATNSDANGLTYRFLAECRSDCEHIRGMLFPWVLSWKESSGPQIYAASTADSGIFSTGMQGATETEVQFSLKPIAPSLDELRWFIDKLNDCHAAAESLNTSEEFTGARIEPEQLDTHLAIPPQVFINMAMRAVKQFQERSESFAAQAIQNWQVLSDLNDHMQTFRASMKG